MSSIFTPHRLNGETQSNYRARRLAAKQLVKRMTLTGPHSPGKSSSREEARNSARLSGAMSKRRRFADVLMAAWARKRRDDDAWISAMHRFFHRIA